MRTYVKSGATMPVTLSEAVTVDEIVTVGEIVGVAATSGAAGDTIELAISGVHRLPKPAAETWAQGAALFHDEAAGRVTTDDASGANAQIGHAFAPAGNPSAEGLVLLGR